MDGVLQFVRNRTVPLRLLALGEPMHGVDAFLEERNAVLRDLVEHAGFRAITIESDCLAALAVDDYVAGGPGTIDEIMAGGFSHGFGNSPANRELVEWLRRHNAKTDQRVRFAGFDPPIEMMSAAAPRTSLIALHDYLTAHLRSVPGDSIAIDKLAGADDRWTNPAAAMDPSQGVGGSPEVADLRLLTDDLTALLHAESPHLIASTSLPAWDRAVMHARTAAGLLRYHAMMADPSPARVARMLGERDAMMAANLLALRETPALVFANNRHLQREASTWDLAGMSLRWWSAGAMTGAELGAEYAFVATAVGTVPAMDIGAPEAGTLEAALAPGLTPADRLPRGLAARTETSNGYFPLDPEHFDGADAVLYLSEA